MARTQTERLWLGGGSVVALLVAVIGYVFFIGPQRSQTADVQSQVASAQLNATTLQSRIVSLTAAQQKLPTYRAAMARAGAALPSLDDRSANPDLLRALQAIAKATSTSVSSLTIAAPAAATAAPAQSSSSGTASAAPSSAASSGAGSASGAGGSAPTGGLYSIAITTAVSGTSAHLADFLTRLQLHQPRALLVTGVTLGAGTQPGVRGSSMNLTMTAFVRPSKAGAAPAAGATPTPGGPAPAASSSTP